MGLNDLVKQKGEERKKKQPKKATDKAVQHSFTVRHDVSTKVLLDKIQRIKELTTPNAKNISQGSIICEALELLAVEMDFKKLQKKHAEFLSHINEESILKK